MIDEINVAEWFRVKSPSSARCKEGDLPLLNFSNLTCMIMCYGVPSNFQDITSIHQKVLFSFCKAPMNLYRWIPWQLFIHAIFFRVHSGIFSAPELKAHVHCCDHTLSVVRPLLLTFHIFDFSSETVEQNLTKLYKKIDLNALYQVCVFRSDRKNKMAALASDWLRHFQLLLWNRWTEFNKNWQEARSQPSLPSLCFSERSEKQDGRPGLWLAETFSTSLRNHWTEFNETWQEARSQRPLPSLCFSGRSKKQDGRPGLWLAETFSTSPLKPLKVIQRNLTESKISTPSTKFVFFGPIRKTKWSPWPLIGWDIFDFSSETAERNSTKPDRKQDLNAHYEVCVYQADQKNKMATLVSDWLRHFWLLLRNCWKEFNETGQKPSAQRPLPSLCFSGRSKKQYGSHGLWLTETYFDFSSETAEWNSAKLDRKQDLNVLYQVCVYRVEK